MAALIPVQVPDAPPVGVRRFVEWLQVSFFPGAMDASTARWVAFLLILLVAILVGRFLIAILFSRLRKIAARANNQLIVPALEAPSATLVILWGMACAGGAVVDHFAVGARARELHLAAFIPLIKRTLGAFFIIFSILVVCESLGFEVKTFLAGLGIGGLAFALAAQDTIANMFGSFVVVMDQPFYVGEYIRILAHEGTVEEIGLRSTRLRTAQRTQIVIPNKTVAAEVITNYTRMPQRRVDTTLGVTYDSPSEAVRLLLDDVRALLRADPGVHQGQVVVRLADLGDASLRVQILYFTADPDWESHMAVRERVNFGILAAVAARGVSLNYPSPVIRMDPAAAQRVSPTP
jgi:MscS family membrane protein